jgi:hypothetical protein
VTSCATKAWTEARATVEFCDADYPGRNAAMKRFSESEENRAIRAVAEFDANGDTNQDKYFKWDAEISAKMLEELTKFNRTQ